MEFVGAFGLIANIIGVVSGTTSIVDALKKQYGDNSKEYQIYCALNNAFASLCERQGWEYDPSAVEAAFRSQIINYDYDILSGDNQLKKMLEFFVGDTGLVTDSVLKQWRDCLSWEISGYPQLNNYLQGYHNSSKTSQPIMEAVPKLTVIPDPPMKLFGREQVILDIKNKLEKSSIVCIYADGGVGKTAVAAVVMDDIISSNTLGGIRVEHFAWITSSGNLRNDIAMLDVPAAKELTSPVEKFNVIFNFLQKETTFLVIDNMDTIPGSDDRGILNSIKEKTKVLITSRIPQKRIKEKYELRKLDPSPALAFFYQCYFGDNDFSVEELESREDAELVQKIVQAAAYNALLIELIGKMAQWEYADELDILWAKIEKDIFNISSNVDIDNDHSSSHGLSKEDLTLQKQISGLYELSDLSEGCREIMNFLAQFPPETSIFEELLKWAEFSINDLKWLVDRAWIERTKEGYLLHTMVKGSVWKQDIGFNIWKYENLIDKLGYTNEYMPVTDGYLNVGKRLIPVKVICNLIAESIGKKLKDSNGNMTVLTDAGYLFNNLAGVYWDHGNYEDALKYYLMALEIRKRLLGIEHPDTAATYDNLAGVYREQGDYEDALKYYLMALEINEKVLGEEDPDTAMTYNGLAGVYQDQGNYEEALKYYQKALVINEKLLGKEHPNTAATYNDLALLYSVQLNYEEALKYYQKALDIREKVFGKEHLCTGAIYNNIAIVYQELGKHEDALKYYQKDLRITEKLLGKEHPYTATTYNNIAVVYQEQEYYEKALKYYLKALDIRKKVLGKEHPYTATTYNNIAKLYREQRYYEEALKYYQKALDIREKALGKEHPDTAATYNDLAMIYQAQGNYEEALKWFLKDLKISEKVFGKKHPFTAITYNNLGLLFIDMKRYEESLKYLRMALSIYKEKLRHDHPYTEMTGNSLAYVENVINNQKS